MALELSVKPPRVVEGGVAMVEVVETEDKTDTHDLSFDISGPVDLPDGFKAWVTENATLEQVSIAPNTPLQLPLDTSGAIPGSYTVIVAYFDGNDTITLEQSIDVTQRLLGPGDDVAVALKRTATAPTGDQALWSVIRASTRALGFLSYQRFMDLVMCGDVRPSDLSLQEQRQISDARKQWSSVNRAVNLPFPDVDAYRQLKVATEVFMMVNCGVFDPEIQAFDLADESRRFNRALGPGDIEAIWEKYTQKVRAGGGEPSVEALPYLALVRAKLPEVPIAQAKRPSWKSQDAANYCYQIITEKMTAPCFLELIWSYWHEEGMLVQTLNAVSWRFQNRRSLKGGRDPLATLEIDPLRPLNQFLWGYIQDEQHRLSVVRRAYEYDHHYGLTLLGKAVPPVRGADSRSRFIEAFHNLLHVASIFYKEDDDTTVLADGFPLLNALKEVHLLLTEGAHNQYGDLPWTARQEMLIQEWLLARPEMREFLPSRIMVALPEPWMDRVEAMKTLQGWPKTSVLHFRDLAIFGEQALLGIRYGNWTDIHDPDQAANWARYWRPEIQGYVHAYRAVTGVDLTLRVDPTPPAVHLQRRAPAAVGR